MRKISFFVDTWSAWSSDRPEAANWLAWAQDAQSTQPDQLPDISMIPAMQRRRMSSLSKMALATALKCTDHSQAKPNCVFATQHGELTRTIKILDSVTEGTDLSPTDFSLSVHNTALGLFSIFTDNKQPATTIVAGADTFGSALLEAAVFLNRFPTIPVLLVYFDEPLPPPLNQFETPATDAFAIALLLSPASAKAGSFSVSCHANTTQQQSQETENLGLNFLKFYLSNRLDAELRTRRTIWHWSRQS